MSRTIAAEAVSPLSLAGAEGRVSRVTLEPLNGFLTFEDCPEIAQNLASLLRGWETGVSPGEADVLARVTRRPRDYLWTPGRHGAPEDWHKMPPETDFDVLCELQFELVDWLVARHPRWFYLHCAAVAMRDGLVVFPSPRRAGKSTLTIHLAASGFRVFTDDALPVEPERHHGIAPGIVPRIRLPIAKSVSRGLRDFIAARPAPADEHYRYVALTESELAPHGAQAPIRALVVLDRVESGGATLSPVSQGEMLKVIIERNGANEIPVMETFTRFQALTGQVERFRLTYADGEEAVDLLKRMFAS